MYNRDLLMCRPDYFRIAYQINPYMDTSSQPDPAKLVPEYAAITDSHEAAGRTLHFIEPDPAWPDMVYTANVALVRGKLAVMANLPKERAGEVKLAGAWLRAHGYETFDCPVIFSGQGDALPTGTGAVIKGRGWRSHPDSDTFVADTLGYEIIPVQSVSAEWYDIDLSIGIIKPGVIAVCLETLDQASQERLAQRADLRIIPVSLAEAQKAALNLVSNGTTVIITTGVPDMAAALRAEGLIVVERSIEQLWKGGGSIRCTALALDAN
jgi:N-dimethylarginine dimethylaminohydrolase